MIKRARIGDVIQVLTSQGVAYAQFTHKSPKLGALLSVFEGFHSIIPKDFSIIVDSPPQFQAFFPLQSALNQGLVSVVANVPVADRNKAFPMFRSCVIGVDGRRGPWWLSDGENEKMLTRELSDVEKRYSLGGIISAPLLVKRIEDGYRPEIHDI